MGYDITGATTLAATTDRAVGCSTTTQIRAGFMFLQTGLTGGSNTFTASYKTTNVANTATFVDRRLVVIPL